MMNRIDERAIISAVILSYNRCKEILTTIDKLKKLRSQLPFGLDIIVVDNASIDDTKILVPGLHTDVVFIRKEINNGIAGWNEGFKVVKTKYILVLDDDSCVVSGLTEAIDYLEQNLDTGILALDIVGEQLQGDPNLSPGEGWQHKQAVAGFIGCGAIIKTELYKKIGGFADWIYLYTHEFEYGIRCLNAGYIITFFEQCKVVHRVSDINRSKKRLRMYATRNEISIIYKYFKSSRLKYILRTVLNNLKFIKREGLLSGYHVLLGAFKFLKLRRGLIYTPVATEIQNFYAQNFWSTKPVFLNNNINENLINAHDKIL